MGNEFIYQSITGALSDIQSGAISPGDLYTAYLEQIEKWNPRINAFICVDNMDKNGDKRSNQDFPIPVAVKDMIDVKGFPTTAGSPKFFGDQPSQEDSYCVSKLRESGARIIGKTNTHEIALGVTGVNPHFGPVRNPFKLDRIAGGSSSGSAAAVSAQMCLAALGTDTGGSTRIPAALCGVVGLKPTRGRVSNRGILPLSWNLDHVGVITRTVEDSAIILQIISGYDELDPSSRNVPLENFTREIKANLKGRRAAYAVGEYVENIDNEIYESVKHLERVFHSCGVKGEKLDLSWISEYAQANTRMTQADAAAFHKERLKIHPEWFGVDVQVRLEKGAMLSSSDYDITRRMQAEGGRRMEAIFSIYDFLILPTTAITAPKIESLDSVQSAAQLTKFTSPFNLFGLPALSLPCGLSKEGLPIGFQIICTHWNEKTIFQAGYCYERESGVRFEPNFSINDPK